MKDLRLLHHFLDITVERRPDEMFLHQHTYTLDIIKHAAMADYKLCMTPGEARCKLWASCSGRFLDSEHCMVSPIPDLHMTRHHLRRAADLSAYARSS
jgi:hypothetical protein